MMKKLTKAALLAAATAFMLAGFPACEHDDNNKTEQSGGGSGEQGSGEQGSDDDEPVTVNAGWTFTADSAEDAAWFKELNMNDNWGLDSGSSVKGKVKTEDGIAITPTTGAGATFTFLKTSKSIESGGKDGWKTGTAKVEEYASYATITVKGTCTVTISGKEAGNPKTDGTVRGFVVNDGSSDVMSYEQDSEAKSSSEFEKTFSAVAGKTYTLKAGGVNFYTITCAPAE